VSYVFGTPAQGSSMGSSKVEHAKTIYCTKNQHPKIFELAMLGVKNLESSLNNIFEPSDFCIRNSNMAHFGMWEFPFDC
jgi:hypothetical protein